MNNFLSIAGSVLRRNYRRFVIFLLVLGPGIITAVADNDAGGIATYSVAASIYGYAARFLLIPEMILLATTQEIGARIAMITRKGLGDLIRERYGIKRSIIIFILLFITNQGVVIQNITGLKASLSLFGLSYQLFLPLIILLIWSFLIKGSYKSIQRGFLVLSLFYFVYLLSAITSKPDWRLAVTNTFWPVDIKVTWPYLFARIAVLGTTITAWGQFFIHSYVKDKGLDADKLKFSKIEVYFGSLVTSFFSFMIVVAVSATLYKNGVQVGSAQDAALAIKPFAGDLAFFLFSSGLFVASVLGASIVPLATAYAFSEFFGFERSLDKSFSQSRIFYTFLIIQLFLGFIVALIPNSSLFKLTLYADFLNGAMLPVIFFFLIRFANDKIIMGRYVNSRFDNIVLIGSTIFIIFSVVVTLIGRFAFRF